MIANHDAGGGKLTIPGGVVMEYLPQDPPFEADATVLEQIFKGDSPLMVLLREYEMAVEKWRKLLMMYKHRKNFWIYNSKWIMNMLGSWKVKQSSFNSIRYY